MEKISIILMGVALFLYPLWILLSAIFEKDSIYPQKRDLIIGGLGILTLVSFALAVIFGLVA